ncbi:tetratricopeptide repeat protein [Bacillus sp. REN10]|uniref:tetratricopeptide repeat protein n=1 Tax=Bacillus sp. REN10 TaxID=2782541 RepID=UPI00193B2CA8|nr:tetratricopeptide repeat protein [Bacillus sp. REN10]
MIFKSIKDNYYIKKARAMRDAGNSQMVVHYYSRANTQSFQAKDFALYAEHLHYLGQVDQAIDILEEGRLAFPDDAYLHGMTGYILRESDRDEEALPFLNRAIEMNDDYYWYYYIRALIHQNLGEIELALQDYRESIKREEELDYDQVNSSWYEFGCVLLDHEFVDEALEAFQNALKKEENAIPMFYYRLAKAYEAKGELEAALEAMEKAIELVNVFQEKDESEVQQLYWQRARYSVHAVDTLQSIIQAKFGFLSDYAHLLYITGRQKEAQQAINEAMERYPNDFTIDEFYIEKARAMRDIGNNQMVVHYYSQANTQSFQPKDFALYAEHLHYLGQGDQSIDILEDGRLAFPDDDYLHGMTGYILRELDRNEEALPFLNRAIEMDDDYYWYYYTRALIHQNLGEIELALQDYREAIKREEELDYDQVNSSWYEFGCVLLDHDFVDEALEAFQNALKKEENAIPMFYYRLAKAYEAKGELEAALEAMEKAIELLRFFQQKGEAAVQQLYWQRARYSVHAVDTFQSIIQAKFDFLPDYAHLLYLMGRQKEAQQAINEAMEHYPNDFTIDEFYIEKARAMRDVGNNQMVVYYYSLANTQSFQPKDFALYAEHLHYLGQGDQAIDILEEGRLAFPDDDYLHGMTGHIFREMDRDEEALPFLNRAIELDNDYYWYYYTRALLHQDLGEMDLALQDYREAIKREEALGYDQVNSSWYEFGCVLLDNGVADEALEAFQNALKKEENAIPMFYYRLAKAYEEKGELESALEAMEKAIQLVHFFQEKEEEEAQQLYWERARYSTDAFRTLQSIIKRGFDFLPDYAHLLNATGNHEKAQQMMDEALKRYPNHFSLHMDRGILFFEQEKYEESIPDFQKASQLDEENPNPYYWLSRVYYFMGDYRQALTYCHQLVELDCEAASVYRLRAQLYEKLDRWEKAESDYTTAISKEEDEKDHLYRERSFTRYQQGKFEQAYDDLKLALEENPQLMESSAFDLDQGMVLLGMGYLDQAEAIFTKGIEKEPDAAILYEKRARCRLSQEKLPEALEDCSKSIDIAPDYFALFHLRGIIHLHMGHSEDAFADLQYFTENMPDNPYGFHTLGLICESLGKDTEALAQYSKAISLNAFIAEPYYRRALLRSALGLSAEAASDLVHWVSLHGKELSSDMWPALLEQIEDIDELIVELALEKIKKTYGKTSHLLS